MTVIKQLEGKVKLLLARFDGKSSFNSNFMQIFAHVKIKGQIYMELVLRFFHCEILFFFFSRWFRNTINEWFGIYWLLISVFKIYMRVSFLLLRLLLLLQSSMHYNFIYEP